jgi:nucleoside-diphosphate-sugar epimerase
VSDQARAMVQRDCAEAVGAGAVEALGPLRDTRLVVTGGTGFMGKWICEVVAHLNDQHGFGVRMDLVARRADAFRATTPWLADRDDVTVHERDVRNVVEFPRDTGWIVHAAGTPDNRIHTTDPVRTIQTFVHGTDAVLRAASRLEGLHRLVHVSSGLVYGPQPLDGGGVDEEFRGAGEFSSVHATYPSSKRMGETLAGAYRSEHRLPTVTVRPFAFIGPYQALTAPWAVNNFLQDSLHGGPIRILGNGDTVRSYMYPTDMAVWVLTALVRGRDGHAYNLGSSDAVTLRDLAHRIASHFAASVEVVEGGAGQRPSRPSRFVPDTGLAARELGVAQTVGLDDAIRRTLAWHQATAAGGEALGRPGPALRPLRAVGGAT